MTPQWNEPCRARRNAPPDGSRRGRSGDWMPSGVATAGEAGIEAALVSVLRRTRGAVVAVTVVTRVVVTVVTAAVVCAVVAAEIGIRVALVIRGESGREVAAASERASVVTGGAVIRAEALVRAEASVPEASVPEASGSETVPTTTSAGARRAYPSRPQSRRT